MAFSILIDQFSYSAWWAACWRYSCWEALNSRCSSWYHLHSNPNRIHKYMYPKASRLVNFVIIQDLENETTRKKRNTAAKEWLFQLIYFYSRRWFNMLSDFIQIHIGIYWDKLSPEKLGQIKILRELKSQIEQETGEKLPSGPSEKLPPTAQRKRRWFLWLFLL